MFFCYIRVKVPRQRMPLKFRLLWQELLFELLKFRIEECASKGHQWRPKTTLGRLPTFGRRCRRCRITTHKLKLMKGKK